MHDVGNERQHKYSTFQINVYRLFQKRSKLDRRPVSDSLQATIEFAFDQDDNLSSESYLIAE